MSLQILSAFKQANRTNIRVGISIWSNVKIECLNSSLDCNPGAELSLLQSIADILKLNLIIKVADEPGCGYLNSEGKWTGLMGMLYNNAIDITGNLCTLDPRRTNISWLGHSFPVIQDKQSFLIKAPKPHFEFSVGAPFQITLWFILLGFLFIFLFYFLLYYSCVNNRFCKRSILDSLSACLKITLGLDPPVTLAGHVLLISTGFVGYISTLYSTFITVAILNPVSQQRPFKNYKDVINLLDTGQYKLVDYHKPAATFRCFEDCEKLKSALANKGYQYYSQDDPEFIDRMMNGILDESRMIFPQSELWLRFFLDNFKQRHKIWLLPDDNAGEARLAYFYRKDFNLSKALEQCIHFMGSYKDNFRFKLFGLSFQAIQREYIKGEIPKKLTLNLKLLKGPAQLYFGGLILSLLSFLGERLILTYRDHLI